MTVNKTEKYPLPRIQDLFAALSGGQAFTKLDLANAYLQLPLEDKSRDYVTINTHKGLFRYNRLPFGVASAPAVFQRTIESLLQRIQRVVAYIDDILITGESEQEHLKNLDEVLKRLEAAGLRLKQVYDGRSGIPGTSHLKGRDFSYFGKSRSHQKCSSTH